MKDNLEFLVNITTNVLIKTTLSLSILSPSDRCGIFDRLMLEKRTQKRLLRRRKTPRGPN